MDPCAKAMIEQTQGIETERLLISCRVKECEHRIELQTQSKEKLLATLKNKEQMERETGASLEKLSSAQDHLKRQLLSQADSLRKCEVEEALLLTNAETQLKLEVDDLAACQAKMSELQALRAAFKTPALVSQIEHEIDTLHQTRLALNAEQESLLADVRKIEHAIEAAKMPLGSAALLAAEEGREDTSGQTPAGPLPVSFTAPDDSADAEEIQLLRAQVEQKKAEVERLASHSATRNGTVQREVADLTKRSAELHLWRDQARSSLEHLEARRQALELVKAQHACFQCLHATPA